MNKELTNIYEALKQHDETLSQRRLSKDYLGRSEAYLFSNNYYGRDISKGAAVSLYNNLKSMADTWGELYEETPRERFKQYQVLYGDLAQKAQRLALAE
ncbi:MAG: hypothetical protein Cons2KO_00200 [Congregibacter sp.]